MLIIHLLSQSVSQLYTDLYHPHAAETADYWHEELVNSMRASKDFFEEFIKRNEVGGLPQLVSLRCMTVPFSVPCAGVRTSTFVLCCTHTSRTVQYVNK